MNDLQVLFIAGNWTQDGGRTSNYMTKLINSFESKLGHPIQAFNGGNIDDLSGILEKYVPDADFVFWSPNIPSSLSSKRRINPKNYNHRVTLVNFKRNDGRYSFDDMMSISITLRADLTCEVRKNDEGRYEMRIYDILGNLWSDFTTNTSKSVATLISRAAALKALNYTKFRHEDTAIPPTNDNLDEILAIYKDYGLRLVEVAEPSEHVKRHLGEIAFRGSTDRDNSNYDIIYASERNLRLSEDINENNFIATRLDRNTLSFYGDRKPHLNAALFNRIMQEMPGINYIFFSQCYLKEAKFTERILTKGCNQEFEEIKKVIEENNYAKDGVNIIGQGSIILGSNLVDIVDKFSQLVKRELPEAICIDFDTIMMDDGEKSFINILGDKALEDGELLEVQFMDGSIGTYNIKVKEFLAENEIYHREAYVELVIKGMPIDFPLTGTMARRI